jgi:CRP/FNR family transcriptional regulator, cyclic AMP receptor protein
MSEKRERTFSTDSYLATAGPGRKIIRIDANEILSSQGDPADCLFFLQTGRAKLSIVSKGGKEATDRLPDQNASRPKLLDPQAGRARPAR